MSRKSLFAFLCVVATLVSAQDANFALGKNKKLIKFGWDAPTPEFIEKNFAVIEEGMSAFDGLSIDFNSSTHRKEREKGNYAYPAGSGAMFFSDWKWERSFFTKEIEQLKAANAKFRTLKHNFISTNSMAADKNKFDWFDDKMWEAITHNFALMAAIAKETGCLGLNIDIENYERQTFQFNPAMGHSYQVTWDKARQRGREFITALVKAYPDIVLHTFFWLDQNYVNADGITSPYEKSEKWIMGLTLPFINGIYDVLPETATIVEGMESYGYRASGKADYEAIIAIRHKKSKWLIDPKNYEKYLRRTQLGMATYLDRYICTDPESVWFLSPDPTKNLTALRDNMTHAFAVADEYVWVWGESRSWYPWTYSTAWMKKHADSVRHPGPLWEDALPDISDVLIYAKNPQRYYRKIIQSGPLGKNLLGNGQFDDPQNADGGKLPPDTAFLEAAKPWGCWQESKSTGTFSIADKAGRNKSNAAKISGVTSGCILQSPVFLQEGVYYIRARVKCFGTANASLSIGWFDHNGRWNFWGYNRAEAFKNVLPDGWKEAEILLTREHFPPKAVGISIQVGVKSPGNEQDVCLVDEVEFYNLNQTRNEKD